MTAPKPKPDLSKLADKLKAAKSKVKVSDLVSDLTIAFGGTHMIAQRFVEEFRDGKAGGIGRAKLLDAYVRLLQHTDKREDAVSASDLTDDELDAQMNQFVEKFISSTPILPPAEEPTDGPPPPINP